MTAGRYDQAEILVALWKLGADSELIPTSHGILDRALEAMKERLPEELASLTFGTTGVGLRSFELPDILLAAQEAMLTSEPNPTYLSTLVTVSDTEAEDIIASHGLEMEKARELGTELRNKVDALRGQGWQSKAVA